MWLNPQFPTVTMVIFTEEILNRKLHFFVQGNEFRELDIKHKKLISIPSYKL